MGNHIIDLCLTINILLAFLAERIVQLLSCISLNMKFLLSE